jgi:two-component system heavy metal sensor histidine kinase CusS
MSGQRARSLGRRLSWWLALQTFAGLAAVCLLVYGAMVMALQARQEEVLGTKQAAVSHLLGEFAREGSVQDLQHKLDDLLFGHDELALTVAAAGVTLYRSASRAPAPEATRERDFDVPGPVATGGVLRARLTLFTRGDQRLLHDLAVTLTAAAIAGALMVSVGGFWLVRHGLSPVRQLVDQTRRLGADKLAQRLDGSAQPEELQPLVQQFNALLGRLEATYANLEGFNADVAHELNTPLALLISGSELALRGPHTRTELLEVLGANLEELHRLADIVTDMLFLAGADRGALARREPAASLAAVAQAVLDYHEPMLEEAGLNACVEGDVGGAFDLPLLRRAMANLVSNAARHTVAGSTLRVALTRTAEERATIAVANQGAPIDARHRERLFERFYRVDAARGGGHHGLGLAIVAAIARMHGGHPFVRCEGGFTTIGFEVLTHAPVATRIESA